MQLIKNSIINVNKLTDGKNIIDLNDLDTEIDMIQSIEKNTYNNSLNDDILYCNKISNGQNILNISDLTKILKRNLPKEKFCLDHLGIKYLYYNNKKLSKEESLGDVFFYKYENNIDKDTFLKTLISTNKSKYLVEYYNTIFKNHINFYDLLSNNLNPNYENIKFYNNRYYLIIPYNINDMETYDKMEIVLDFNNIEHEVIGGIIIPFYIKESNLYRITFEF